MTEDPLNIYQNIIDTDIKIINRNIDAGEKYSKRKKINS